MYSEVCHCTVSNRRGAKAKAAKKPWSQAGIHKCVEHSCLEAHISSKKRERSSTRRIAPKLSKQAIAKQDDEPSAAALA